MHCPFWDKADALMKVNKIYDEYRATSSKIFRKRKLMTHTLTNTISNAFWNEN